jgi:hypothetical protein
MFVLSTPSFYQKKLPDQETVDSFQQSCVAASWHVTADRISITLYAFVTKTQLQVA